MNIIHNQYRQSFAETGKKAFDLDKYRQVFSEINLGVFNEEGSVP
jgi:hypothetical protein